MVFTNTSPAIESEFLSTSRSPLSPSPHPAPSSRPIHFLHLPEPFLLQLFRALSQDDAKSFRATCTRLAALSTTTNRLSRLKALALLLESPPSLSHLPPITFLDFNARNAACSHQLLAALSRHGTALQTSIRGVRLSGRDGLLPALQTLRLTCPRLAALELRCPHSYCGRSTECAHLGRCLAELPAAFPQLTALHLHRLPISSGQLRALCGGLSRLRALSVRGLRSALTSDSLAALSGLSGLVSLSVDHLQLQGRHFPCGPQLRSLELSDVTISAASFATLNSLTALQSLSIWGTGHRSALAFSPLTALPALRRLHLELVLDEAVLNGLRQCTALVCLSAQSARVVVDGCDEATWHGPAGGEAQDHETCAEAGSTSITSSASSSNNSSGDRGGGRLPPQLVSVTRLSLESLDEDCLPLGVWLPGLKSLVLQEGEGVWQAVAGHGALTSLAVEGGAGLPVVEGGGTVDWQGWVGREEQEGGGREVKGGEVAGEGYRVNVCQVSHSHHHNHHHHNHHHHYHQHEHHAHTRVRGGATPEAPNSGGGDSSGNETDGSSSSTSSSSASSSDDEDGKDAGSSGASGGGVCSPGDKTGDDVACNATRHHINHHCSSSSSGISSLTASVCQRLHGLGGINHHGPTNTSPEALANQRRDSRGAATIPIPTPSNSSDTRLVSSSQPFAKVLMPASAPTLNSAASYEMSEAEAHQSLPAAAEAPPPLSSTPPALPPHLAQLHLGGCEGLPEQAYGTCARLPALTSCSLIGCVGLTSSALRALLAAMPGLRELALEGAVHVTDEGLVEIGRGGGGGGERGVEDVTEGGPSGDGGGGVGGDGCQTGYELMGDSNGSGTGTFGASGEGGGVALEGGALPGMVMCAPALAAAATAAATATSMPVPPCSACAKVAGRVHLRVLNHQSPCGEVASGASGGGPACVNMSPNATAGGSPAVVAADAAGVGLSTDGGASGGVGLRRLTLTRMPGITARGVAAVAGGLPYLRELTVSSCQGVCREACIWLPQQLRRPSLAVVCSHEAVYDEH